MNEACLSKQMLSRTQSGLLQRIFHPYPGACERRCTGLRVKYLPACQVPDEIGLKRVWRARLLQPRASGLGPEFTTNHRLQSGKKDQRQGRGGTPKEPSRKKSVRQHHISKVDSKHYIWFCQSGDNTTTHKARGFFFQRERYVALIVELFL